MQRQKKYEKPAVLPINPNISNLLHQVHILLRWSLWSILLS